MLNPNVCQNQTIFFWPNCSALSTWHKYVFPQIWQWSWIWINFDLIIPPLHSKGNDNTEKNTQDKIITSLRRNKQSDKCRRLHTRKDRIYQQHCSLQQRSHFHNNTKGHWENWTRRVLNCLLVMNKPANVNSSG